MKKCIVILWLALCASTFAQGWINFMNSPVTLFSVRNADGSDVGVHGTYYFSLLTASADVVDFSQFTFAGVYATNQSVAGRFFGGTFLQVPTWAVGTNKSFLIAGWSASLGPTWSPLWLHNTFSNSGFFGLSSIGQGMAGGIIDTNHPPLPPLNLFGAASGIQSGFSLYPVDVPEPSTMAVVVSGIALIAYVNSRRARSGNSKPPRPLKRHQYRHHVPIHELTCAPRSRR